jgi:hypothetical protein
MLLVADSNSLAASRLDGLSLPSDHLPGVISCQGCMPFYLRSVLSRCGPHMETTLVGHKGNMRVKSKWASQGLTLLGFEKHPELRVRMG